ncbi:MAG: DUF4159 domain-containing protein [Candidatus Methylacidiphilales bacterium]|nr:DUF4159 domain-containing protein [Candidatus Methylacidiphilales bacterium]
MAWMLLVSALCVGVRADDEKMSTFFVGRLKYSSNNGNDCANVGNDLVALVSRVSTIKMAEERLVKLSDESLHETPFLFMNGHFDFVLTDQEIASLRSYLDQGGFLMASGCCTNPAFPKAWRREMGRIFPGETVKRITYDHLIYRSFYKIDSIRAVHDQSLIYVEGLVHDGNIVALLCEEGLCCSFSMDNRCNSNRGVPPEIGKKLAVNIAVYALTH